MPATHPTRYRCMCLVIRAEGELRLGEQDAGEPGPGQVLVKVKVSLGGICGSDLHYFRHGGFGTVRLQQPMVLGHEVAGTVAALGEGVTALRIGQGVAINPSQPCTGKGAACKFCREGLPNQCLEMRFYGSAMRMPHVQGAFRNLLLCQASQCVPVADGVGLRLAALAEPFSVGLHAVSRAGSLLGKRVLVSGCGPIGVLAVAAARVHGAAEVGRLTSWTRRWRWRARWERRTLATWRRTAAGCSATAPTKAASTSCWNAAATNVRCATAWK